MATFKQRGKSWQVQVAKLGVRRSATFPTKAKAERWAIEIESQILSNKIGAVSNSLSLFDAIDKYIAAEAPSKRNPSEYEKDFRHLQKSLPYIHLPISKVTTELIAQYRDERVKVVSGSTVRRELSILSGVFEFARRELKAVYANPVKDVKKPQQNPHRERRIPVEQEQLILNELGYREDECKNKAQETGYLFVLALETAMRLGEICNIKKSDVFPNYVRLPKTKNGSARNVPLSSRAKNTLSVLINHSETDNLTDRTTDAVSKMLDWYTKKLVPEHPELDDLTFHDTRHEATYRLSKKVEVLELSKITGHKDIKMLLIYYNPTMDELASKLD